MKWTNKQYVDLMTYQNVERVMFSELFGPIVGLDKEWRAQGASEEHINLTKFAFDYVPLFTLGNLRAINGPKTQVIEDSENYYIAIDCLGRKVVLDKKTATIPLPQNYPVETMDDWQKIKYMFEYCDERVLDKDIEKAISLQKQGVLIKADVYGGFDIIRELMGEENGCIAYYEDPELVMDILNTLSKMNKKVLEKISSRITLDQLSIHEDMAGNAGPMVGPNIVREFYYPYYKNVWEVVSNSGTKLFCQDSDGDINLLLDDFIKCGVNIFNPCEPAGNMDVVQLRKKYGNKIAFKGGIDKYVLRKSKQEIKAEIDYKVQDCMLNGGMVFSLDHRIPNGTPFENYVYYVSYVREKLGLEPFEESEAGWGPMMF